MNSDTDEEERFELNEICAEYHAVLHSQLIALEIDLTSYDIRYFETDTQYFVYAGYKHRNPRLRGCGPGLKSYEIAIEKGSKRVLHVYVAR